MIPLTCPYCRHEWSVADAIGGRSVWCPQCGTPTDVPIREQGSSGHSPTVDSTYVGSREAIDFAQFLSAPVDSGELGRLGGYRVLRPIGEGGMGIVFEAEDPILKRRIAMKVMRPDVARSDVARKRFLREAEAAAQLKHDHILSIYHIGEDRDVLYLTMPLLQGETLETRLRREPRLPVPEVIAIGKQVAEGLAAAHAKGLIHRDVKPGNIWLETPNQRAIILDFGLARQTKLDTDVTGSGVIVGSPAFMAPEQASGKEVGPAADLFSLGCVLYLIGTGQRPFQGTEVMAVLMALVHDIPIAPRRLRPEIPDALSRLIMNLLEKLPADRPDGADRVVQELMRINPSLRDGIALDSTRAAPSGKHENRATIRDEEGVSAKAPRTGRIILGIVAAIGIIAVAVGIRRSGRVPTPRVDEPAIERGRTELVVDKDAWNREVAERILDAGGVVQFHLPGEEKSGEARAPRQLPAGPFRIQMIALENIPSANALMDSMHDLEDFTCLAVKNSPLDDVGAAKLRSLPNLEWLVFKDTRVTGIGFAGLRNLPRLRFLDVVDAPIADEGFAAMEGVAHLERLMLQGTNVTGRGLRYLAKAVKLHRLYVTRCPLDDAGLAYLPILPELRELSLQGTAITDAGLVALTRQPALTHLYLEDTRVTQRGAEQFRKNLGRDCDVVFGPKRKSK